MFFIISFHLIFQATAREMFLKSISDLIYNCAQSYSNSSYLLERNCVDIFTQMRDETFHVVDARKVNMTLLLTLSYLIDDNNYDVIIPDEGKLYFRRSTLCIAFPHF